MRGRCDAMNWRGLRCPNEGVLVEGTGHFYCQRHMPGVSWMARIWKFISG